MLIRYIENLPDNEIPDPDLILKGSMPLKTYFSNMRDAAKENLAKWNRQPDTVQLGFQMFEDTLLAYMTVSMKYAEEITRLRTNHNQSSEKKDLNSVNRRQSKHKTQLPSYYETYGI